MDHERMGRKRIGNAVGDLFYGFIRNRKEASIRGCGLFPIFHGASAIRRCATPSFDLNAQGFQPHGEVTAESAHTDDVGTCNHEVADAERLRCTFLLWRTAMRAPAVMIRQPSQSKLI